MQEIFCSRMLLQDFNSYEESAIDLLIALILMILGGIGTFAHILFGYGEMNDSLRNIFRIAEILFWGSMVYLLIQSEKNQ